MSLPALPRRAAYITLNNPQRRNALSLGELRSLRDQLLKANTSPTTGRTYLLPPFKPSILSKLEQSHAHYTREATTPHNPATKSKTPPTNPAASNPQPDEAEDYTWLTSAHAFHSARHHLPSVLVLTSSPGPIFSSGHDLRELRTLSPPQVRETFRLCAEVMTLLRRSPALVISRVAGHALAAGCQLAMSADLPLAHEGVRMRLPGAAIGLPCSSPVTAASRRVGNGKAFWMMAGAEEVGVGEMRGAVRVVRDGDGDGEGNGDGGGGGDGGGRERGVMDDAERVRRLDREVVRTVERLVGMSPQQNAMGKWAFWTQAGLTGRDYVGADGIMVEGTGGDGYLDAVDWAGRVMALHAKSEDAQEGMDAFLEKRQPVWYGFEQP